MAAAVSGLSCAPRCQEAVSHPPANSATTVGVPGARAPLSGAFYGLPALGSADRTLCGCCPLAEAETLSQRGPIGVRIREAEGGPSTWARADATRRRCVTLRLGCAPGTWVWRPCLGALRPALSARGLGLRLEGPPARVTEGARGRGWERCIPADPSLAVSSNCFLTKLHPRPFSPQVPVSTSPFPASGGPTWKPPGEARPIGEDSPPDPQRTAGQPVVQVHPGERHVLIGRTTKEGGLIFLGLGGWRHPGSCCQFPWASDLHVWDITYMMIDKSATALLTLGVPAKRASLCVVRSLSRAGRQQKEPDLVGGPVHLLQLP
ncbi:uncharacterized protein LOC118149719 [Callithrix jacchus]